MAHLTYTFKLLQTKGRKGKALHEAMRRWTTAHREFLDIARDKIAEFEEACTRTTTTGRQRRSTMSMSKWVRKQITPMPSYQALESSMKDSLISHIAGQLMSFLELRNVQDDTGFPSGRGYTEQQYEEYLEQFVYRDWTPGPDYEEEDQELEYATVQGKVQGYKPKSVYSPVEFCRYEVGRNYFLAKSDDGQYFAALYLTTEDTGFRLNGNALTVVGKDVPVKSLGKRGKAILVPLATSKWVLRKLEAWRPETSRLVYRDGVFYLHVAFETPQPEARTHETLLGVDMGKDRTAAIAVISVDGRTVLYSESVPGLHRQRINDINAKVAKAQAKGGHYRYRKYGKINEEVAHTIANGIIALARKHRSKIVVEDLKSMRQSMMAKSGKSNFNKGRKHNLYGLLLKALEYKCAAQGIGLEQVGAAYTSQTCPGCGHIDPQNRLTVTESPAGPQVSRLRFRCLACGFMSDNSDVVAAINIARKLLYKEVCIVAKKKNTKIPWQDFARSFCSG